MPDPVLYGKGCVCVCARAELTRFLMLWKPDMVLQNDRKQKGIIRSDESLELHNNAEFIAYTGTAVPAACVFRLLLTHFSSLMSSSVKVLNIYSV